MGTYGDLGIQGHGDMGTWVYENLGPYGDIRGPGDMVTYGDVGPVLPTEPRHPPPPPAAVPPCPPRRPWRPHRRRRRREGGAGGVPVGSAPLSPPPPTPRPGRPRPRGRRPVPNGDTRRGRCHCHRLGGGGTWGRRPRSGSLGGCHPPGVTSTPQMSPMGTSPPPRCHL